MNDKPDEWIVDGEIAPHIGHRYAVANPPSLAPYWARTPAERRAATIERMNAYFIGTDAFWAGEDD